MHWPLESLNSPVMRPNKETEAQSSEMMHHGHSANGHVQKDWNPTWEHQSLCPFPILHPKAWVVTEDITGLCHPGRVASLPTRWCVMTPK